MSIETYQEPGNGNGVARHQPQNQVAQIQPRTVQRLTDWAESARAAHEVACSLVQTSFVPQQFRDKPHEATAAILAGDEVGLNPMASLRAFDIIQGTAAPRAMTQRAVVQSVGHEIWVHESTETRAIVKGRRAGSSMVQESVWTIDRARGLALLGKDNWKKQPGAMLVARASSECARLIASDALMGMPYSIEELADNGEQVEFTPVGTEPAAPGQPAKRTAQRRSAPRSAPAAQTPETGPPAEPAGPPLPGEEEYDEPAEPAADTPDPITDPQMKKMQAIFSKADIKSRDTRLEASGLIVGRQIGSAKDLTKDEATRLIDRLEEWSRDGELAVTIAELVERTDVPPADES